jgi:heptosyltransferase-2
MTRIAIVLPNWIGDAVMATPCLRALRRHFGPDARLTGFGPASVCALLAGHPHLDELIALPGKSRRPFERSLKTLARLRRARADIAVLLTNGLPIALLALLAGIPQRVGYDRRGRGPLLTRRLQPPRDGGRLTPIPAVDYYLRLAEALGCAPEPPALELATSAADEAAADELWRELGLGPGERPVVLNNSAGQGSAKLWPEESMAALAGRLARERGLPVLVLASPGREDAARRIVARAGGGRVVSNAHRPPTLGLAKAIIRRARLLVSTDSGPRHFAPAFGVPVVTLYGPTDPRWTDLHTPLDLGLQQAVPCGPCQKQICPEGHHRCMRELAVDRVWQAVETQLDRFAA